MIVVLMSKTISFHLWMFAHQQHQMQFIKYIRMAHCKATMSGNNNHGVDYAFGFQTINNQNMSATKLNGIKYWHFMEGNL